MSKKAYTRTAILIASCAGVLLICLLFFASRASNSPSYQEYAQSTPSPGVTTPAAESSKAPVTGTVAENQTPTEPDQPEEEEPTTPAYTLILRDGTLTVLAPDDPEQNGRIIDFDTSFLTQDEKQNLKNGVHVDSKEELLVLLEGFAS